MPYLSSSEMLEQCSCRDSTEPKSVKASNACACRKENVKYTAYDVMVLRLISETLENYGLDKCVEELNDKLNGKLRKSDPYQQFRSYLRNNEYGRCLGLLDALAYPPEKKGQHIQNIQLLIYQQQYLELLEVGRSLEALEFLQQHIKGTLLARKESDYLGTLVSLVLCDSQQQLQEMVPWFEGKLGQHRLLLEEINQYFSSQEVLPKKRLHRLIEEAKIYRNQQSSYHNCPPPSFLEALIDNCVPTSTRLPIESLFLLEDHSDEVWDLKFSNNGDMLASVSRDKSVIVWKLSQNSTELLHQFNGHEKCPHALSWSPNDHFLLTCSLNTTIHMWNIQNGDSTIFPGHLDAVQVVAWLSDSIHFISGGLDCCVILWNSITGDRIRRWKGELVNDFVIHPKEQCFYAVCHESRICRYSLTEPWQRTTVLQQEAIMSLSISRNGRFLLINAKGKDGLSCYDTVDNCSIRYTGHRKERYVVRATFGGCDDGFICSGSEDASIYIWRRATGKLEAKLQGHSAVVNAVSWCPTNPHLLASASDDQTIRIWGLRS